MATLDLIHKSGGKPAGFVNLGRAYRPGSSDQGWTDSGLQERIEQGLELVTQARGVKVVLVNILEGIVSCVQVAEAIAHYLQRQPYNHRAPLLVARLVGSELEQARERLASVEVPVLDHLDGAIAQAVTLSKSKLV